MRKDRIGIPKELKDEKNREPKSVEWAYCNKKMLVSYADKKKSGTKLVLVLSTMHDTVRVSRDERLKPHPIVYYDHMKGGVDIVDLLSTMLSTRVKSRKWTMNAFAFLLDTVRTNSKRLFKECCKEKNLTNFEFTWRLGKELVSPFIQQRCGSTGLPSTVQKKINRVLGNLLPNQPPVVITGSVDDGTPHIRNTLNQGRCKQCKCSILGDDFKKNYAKLNTRISDKCLRCTDFVCKKPEHYGVVCATCQPKLAYNITFQQ